ncbi:hypothetical protein POM88_041160 [Heracleum sosnowskyi]|uniref:Uncharacterized protein n=1 Tax=Heracleum sosnowskyi TaxID=360622 RepID=A0AAD8MAH6_9APIA|nr:hypothetical protein POM88_041160 [Heracleum sosnowskyi]
MSLSSRIAPRRGRPSLEALACVGNIAKAMGPAMEPHAQSLLDSMFAAGLSFTLVEALEQITISIPSLLPTIQNRLLECISAVLSQSYHAQAKPSITSTRANGHDLLEFVRDSVVVYLEDEDAKTRKDAALCCCKSVSNSFSGMLPSQYTPGRSSRARGKRRRLIEELTECGTKNDKVPETDLPDIEMEEVEAGRHDPKCLKTCTSAPAPTDSYVQKLTKKIRQEVAVEVEAKVNQKVCDEVDGKINRKVQDNLTLALKKLAEANPTLNVDIGEICATISSDTVGDGTPMTNGPSS